MLFNRLKFSAAGPAWRALAFAAAFGAALPAPAEPITTGADDQLIDRMPASNKLRRVAQRENAAATTAPFASTRRPNPMLVAQEARGLLQAARAEGDPRAAGQALALLAPWKDDARAPAQVILMLATVEQFLHEFDTANRRLEALVARDPSQSQAWLTLATLRRLRGDYDSSDAACRALLPLGIELHGQACLAENMALRGQDSQARALLAELLKSTADGATRNWLLTTLAEAEQRDGRPRQAEAAYKAALLADADAYTTLDFADLLIDQKRPAQALVLLKDQPRSDAVLLRLAIAGRQSAAAQAPADIAELTERFTQAALRPGGISGHAREHAMYWLYLRDDPLAALRLAGENLQQQREPVDLLLYARAARAANARDCLVAVAGLQKVMHLHDRRLDSLLH
jgi:Tfp pilus assembly protein PilF